MTIIAIVFAGAFYLGTTYPEDGPMLIEMKDKVELSWQDYKIEKAEQDIEELKELRKPYETD